MRLPRRHHGRHAGPRQRGDRAQSLAQILLPDDPPLRPMKRHLVRAGVRLTARTLVAAAILIGLANLSTSTNLPTGPAAAPPPSSPAQAALMKRFNCSPDGFGDGSTPRSAIIRGEDGLRVVSFDRGWQVYTGTRPHALVAVCHEPPR